MNHPYDILEQLDATSSKNEKLAILKREGSNMLWKEVCEMALHPMINFGMTKAPTVTKHAKLTDLRDLGSALKEIRKTLAVEKLRGHAARDFMVAMLENLDRRAAFVIECVIAKDLDCGVDTAVNKVWKNFIHEWPVMLCAPEGEIDYPCIVQLKEDGMRINILVEGSKGVVSYFSRNGRELDFQGRFDKMFLKMAGRRDVVFDGEGLMMQPDGKWMPRKAGNGLIKKSMLKGMSKAELDMLRFALWDVILLDAWRKGFENVAYERRLNVLLGYVELSESDLVHVVPTIVAKNASEAQALFEKYVADGYEGTIKKDMKGPWENARVKHQVKAKAEREADLEVVGTVPHSKNPKLIGSLVCATSDRKLVTGVGSGMDDEDRAKPQSWWLKKIVAVVYNEIIEDKKGGVKSMFLPRLVEVRSDKTKANTLSELS